MVCPLFEDPYNKIAFMDYHLIYETKSLIGIQLYSYGLATFANDQQPGCALEYVPGIIHVPLEVYRAWQKQNIWARFLKSPTEQELANTLAAQVTRSVQKVESATELFESDPVSHFPQYRSALSEMMGIYIVSQRQELFLNAIRDRVHGSPEANNAIDALLTPGITPYGLFLIMQALRAFIEPEYMGTFRKTAAFLRENDADPEVLRTSDAAYVERLGNETGGIPGAQKALTQFQQQEMEKKHRREQSLQWIAAEHPQVSPLVFVWAALCDHEEARHYWQERGARNLKKIAARVGLSPMSCSIQEIEESIQYAADHTPLKF